MDGGKRARGGRAMPAKVLTGSRHGNAWTGVRIRDATYSEEAIQSSSHPISGLGTAIRAKLPPSRTPLRSTRLSANWRPSSQLQGASWDVLRPRSLNQSHVLGKEGVCRPPRLPSETRKLRCTSVEPAYTFLGTSLPILTLVILFSVVLMVLGPSTLI